MSESLKLIGVFNYAYIVIQNYYLFITTLYDHQAFGNIGPVLR
jgi:hypothetical protein